jgi:uncharacterized SAM-binding protein YcdF (DUF218 family)
VYQIIFLVKKIVEPFLLPPGLFILLLLFFGIKFFSKKNWKAGMFNIIIALIMWGMSIMPFSDPLLMRLESGFEIPKDPKGDVIILLGGGINPESPDISGIGVPLEGMLDRIVTAVRLQKRLNIPVIVSGGKMFSRKTSEASIVKRFLIDLGVPSDKIITEEKSRDTIENARYSQEICIKAGFLHPILVTSAYHMRRAVMSFEKTGMNVLPFPSGFQTSPEKKYYWFDYLPTDFDVVRKTMKEYLGLLFYKYAY